MIPITRIFDLLDLYRTTYSEKEDAFGFKSKNVWNTYSAKEYYGFADQFSLGLLQLGIRKGDKVATIISNCPEWNIIDMGLMQIGAIQVPIYPNISKPNYSYIFKETQVKYIFVQNNEMYDRVKLTANKFPSIKEIYSIEKTFAVKNWKEILELGNDYKGDALNCFRVEIKPEDIASIIYTSGTTGKPKGVMLSHENFITNFKTCSSISNLDSKDKAISFLPLCHVYERMLNYLYQYMGVSIYYSESLQTIVEDIKEIKPQVFCTVPRVMEKVFAKIYQTGLNLPWIQKTLFFWALSIAEQFELDYKNGWAYQFKLWLADMFVFRKWRNVFGGQLKFIVSGGANLQPYLSRIFWASGIFILEGYGLTETSPVISVQTFLKNGFKFGTVGKVIKDVEISFDEDGEILCKGPNLMQGYFNHPNLTNRVIDKDGWFHTGDIGELDSDGFLKITDRKKEMFKTSGGKYVAPQSIESSFKASPFIEYIMVIGENRKCPAAIILPNFNFLQSWCKKKKIQFHSINTVLENPLLIQRFEKEIDHLNKGIDKVQQVKKFALIADEWTTESGELSPTLKLRRKFIAGKYRELITNIYEEPENCNQGKSRINPTMGSLM